MAAEPFGISIGMVWGLTRRGPSSRKTSHWPSSVSAPPMPVAMLTASRSGSTSGEPASCHASRAAINASCWVRSSLRASTRSSTSSGSTATRAAKLTGSSDAHSSVSERTPERPDKSASQVDATSPPTGVVAPRPVITTVEESDLGEVGIVSGSRLLDVGDRVADGTEIFHVVVGNLDAKLLFGRDDHLNHRQRVDVEIVGECLVELDVVDGHSRDLV